MDQVFGEYGFILAARQRLEDGLSHRLSLEVSVSPMLDLPTAFFSNPLHTYTIFAGLPGSAGTRVGSVTIDPAHRTYHLHIRDEQLTRIAQDLLDPLFELPSR